nr:2'-5' RNA ligase family protein [uncultured Sphingomonas sp.]
MPGALIVTAGFGQSDFARFDQLRRQHYPPHRNQVPAHLTMFHGLPPSVEPEVVTLLKQMAAGPRPSAMTDGPIKLGQGVAIRIRSDELLRLRDQIADHFRGSLSAQDAGGWRPHVTIQNKVKSKDANALFNQLANQWQDRPVHIGSLELYRYMEGPWASIGRYPFRG